MNEQRVAHHARLNRETSGAWGSFASHRERVSEHLIRYPAQSLAIWGAGNCNDLDLPRLAGHFEQITLFDLDRAAAVGGVQRQLPGGAARIEVVQADAFAAAVDAAKSASATTYNVVASTCLLSQMLLEAHASAGSAPEELWTRIESIREQHVKLLLSMTAPGGWALLFNDFLSSDTCPQLKTCGEDELPALLQRELARGNFFTGLNPFALERFVGTTSALQALIAESQLVRPWKWELGAGRCYAVCVHRWRRR